MAATSLENIDQYIAGFSGDVREKLQTIRELVHNTIPQAVESISYQMPSFKYNGKILVYFAAFKNHIGFYATPEANIAFKDELSAYKTTKGTVQLPYDKPIPTELLRKMILFKATSNEIKKKK
ncbi:MAG: DUF1801 domain-containing protein [Bacteroidia bacterium]|nr:DUF1801 domain-containing protein [Bacteroidia bacterium]